MLCVPLVRFPVLVMVLVEVWLPQQPTPSRHPASDNTPAS
jgi:hypothetical protein